LLPKTPKPLHFVLRIYPRLIDLIRYSLLWNHRMGGKLLQITFLKQAKTTTIICPQHNLSKCKTIAYLLTIQIENTGEIKQILLLM